VAAAHEDGYEELAALRALDVLEGAERADFERHAAQCARCRALVARHRHTLAALLAAPPERDPSPDLKARLMRRAAAELEMAEKDAPSLAPAPVAALDRPGHRIVAGPGGARRAGRPAAVAAPRRRVHPSTWRRPAALAAVGVVLLAMLVLGGGTLVGRLLRLNGAPGPALTADGPARSAATAASTIAATPGPRAGEPTAAPAPPGAASSPAPAAAMAAGADPVQTVERFYALLGSQRYDDLLPLLSPRLRASAPWQPSALRDRTPPGDLVIEQAQLVELSPDQQRASVRVVVRETVPPPLAETRRYVGTWQLVRGGPGWLLDDSDLQLEQPARP
jgi:hypothetical protein